jgi:hypothetical protein
MPANNSSEDAKAARIARLEPHRFKSGIVANPLGAGAPQAQVTMLVRQLCSDAAPQAVATLIGLLTHRDGKVAGAAASAILDRAVGKPQQSLEVTATSGPQRAPIDLSRLTDGELAALQALTKKASTDDENKNTPPALLDK